MRTAHLAGIAAVIGTYLAYDFVIGGAKRQAAVEQRLLETQPERFAAMRAGRGNCRCGKPGCKCPSPCGCG